MAYEKGISDNPFRLTNLPSLVSYATLRRSSEALVRDHQIDRAEPPPLADRFGSDSLENLLSIVRGLRTDPKNWLSYALKWPTTHTALILFWESIGHCGQSKGVEKISFNLHGEDTTTVGQIPPSSQTLVSVSSISFGNPQHIDIPNHNRFLQEWLAFLVTESHLKLSSSLEMWSSVCHDIPFLRGLTNHVAQETGADQKQVKRSLVEVIDEETQAIFDRAISIALVNWSDKKPKRAIDILTAIVSSPLDGEYEERAIRPFIDIGDRLVEEINRVDVRMVYDPQSCCLVFPDQAKRLYALIRCIGERNPRVAYWYERYSGFVGFHADEIKEEARLDCQAGKYKEAIRRLSALVKVDGLSEDYRDSLRTRIKEVRSYLPQTETGNQIDSTANSGSKFISGNPEPRTSIQFPWVMVTFIAVSICAYIWSLLNPNASTPNGIYPATYNTQTTPNVDSGSQAYNSSNYLYETAIDIRLKQLDKELHSLKPNIEGEKRQLNSEAAELKEENKALSNRRSYIKLSRIRLDHSSKLDFNRYVDEFNADIRSYNTRIQSYLKREKEYLKRVHHYNEIVNEYNNTK